MVVTARSTSAKGPWENSPYNPIIRTYSDEEQWWSQGHGTIIDNVNGNWWIVYHAYENSQHPLGRQTLLSPIEWTPDGWPRVAETAHPLKPDPVPGLQLSDDFSGEKLGLQWMTWRRFEEVSLRDESLYLTGKGTSPKDAPLLLITACDHAYEVQTELTVSNGGIGGLVLFYSQRAFDGSNGSRWMAAADDKAAWWQVDLGDARRIERTEAYFVKPAAGHAYKLEVSTDGVTWQHYGGREDVILQSPHIDRKSAVARYLRLTFLKGTAGLWDFRVY